MHMGLLMAAVNKSSKAYVMRAANRIYAQTGYPLLNESLSILETAYNAPMQAGDFSDPSLPAAINNWVTDETANRITDIVGKFYPSTKLILISCLYFKAGFMHEFDHYDTHVAPFYESHGVTKQVG
jgi:serine protease inhibitor